jgi:hypothetical protein
LGTPDDETLGNWFDDMVGIVSGDVEFSKLSAKDKKMMLSKSKMRRKLVEGVKAFNSRRKDAGLGSYSYKKHIVYKKFPTLYKKFKARVLEQEGLKFKSENWRNVGKVRTVRDARGRIVTWQKSK